MNSMEYIYTAYFHLNITLYANSMCFLHHFYSVLRSIFVLDEKLMSKLCSFSFAFGPLHSHITVQPVYIFLSLCFCFILSLSH